MSNNPFKSADKNIVDRRDAHADDMSRQAVRRLRKGLDKRLGLNGHTGNEQERRFAGDMLTLHVRLVIRSRVYMALTILLCAALASLALPFLVVCAWTGAALALFGWTQYCALDALSEKLERRAAKKWERRFLVLQALNGAAWAALFVIHPISGADGDVSATAFAGATVLMGVALLTAKNLKYGVLATSFPLVMVCQVKLSVMMSMDAMGLALVLIAAALFFQHVGDLMRRSDLHRLHSEAERDQLIMELETAKAVSEEARRRAEDSNLAKSRFLATMSHELRTPLNAILGFSEVMSNEVMGPLNNQFYKEYVGDIHTSGSHLLKLINEILDLSRVEAGRYKLHEEAINLVHIVQEAQQMVKLKASDKSITLTMQMQEDMPRIWADPRGIRQVVLNLLSNALKFTPTGGTVAIKCGWTAGGGQYVMVKDSGPGIPEEEIPIVLSSFGQGSIAIKSAEQGTGLGLPIVQALMQIHDGTFELKSKLREGTEAIATFPRSRVLEEMEPVTDDLPTDQGRSFGTSANSDKKATASA